MTDVATERVGKAYMCNDGLVRLITGLSRRNYYSILWREPNDDVWYSGGIVKTEKFPWGWEIERPTGILKVCGSTGRVLQITI
jgi:hypothetical protein